MSTLPPELIPSVRVMEKSLACKVSEAFVCQLGSPSKTYKINRNILKKAGCGLKLQPALSLVAHILALKAFLARTGALLSSS